MGSARSQGLRRVNIALFNGTVKPLLGLLFLTTTTFAATIQLVAGGGSKNSDAPATECRLREPFAVEFTADGAMLIAEMVGGNRVLKVDPAGHLTVIAGTGIKGYSGDAGPA